jgi:hypothetical protein
MTKISRYGCRCEFYNCPGMNQCQEGQYVKLDDVHKVISQIRNDFRDKLDQVKIELDKSFYEMRQDIFMW